MEPSREYTDQAHTMKMTRTVYVDYSVAVLCRCGIYQVRWLGFPSEIDKLYVVVQWRRSLAFRFQSSFVHVYRPTATLQRASSTVSIAGTREFTRWTSSYRMEIQRLPFVDSSPRELVSRGLEREIDKELLLLHSRYNQGCWIFVKFPFQSWVTTISAIVLFLYHQCIDLILRISFTFEMCHENVEFQSYHHASHQQNRSVSVDKQQLYWFFSHDTTSTDNKSLWGFNTTGIVFG